jgi:hypothetical protein
MRRRKRLPRFFLREISVFVFIFVVLVLVLVGFAPE